MSLAKGYHGKGRAGVSHVTFLLCGLWQTVRDWRLPSVTCVKKVRFCPMLPDTQKISVF
jgi:hypothetical protein